MTRDSIVRGPWSAQASLGLLCLVMLLTVSWAPTRFFTSGEAKFGARFKATYGLTPQVLGFDTGTSSLGDGWKVANVIWHGDYYSDSCELFPETDGFGAYVVQDDSNIWP